MKKTSDRIDWILFVICLFLGFFGIDKFYIQKSWKGTWKFALAKFIATLALVGIIWDLWDAVMVLLCRYQYDAREYFA